ncbi:MAG TPA: hypothetical protein VM537_04790 [Anaerolineae bacterium]|nr:hypothetical protein [Anaerolineae bacterium]
MSRQQGTGDRLQRLPMEARHVLLILSGVKTTTLRTRKLTGEYGLYMNGERVARVLVKPEKRMCLPVSLDALAGLVASEGYPGDERRWRAAICRLLNVRGHTAGTDFLARARSLWLHKLTVLERHGWARQ